MAVLGVNGTANELWRAVVSDEGEVLDSQVRIVPAPDSPLATPIRTALDEAEPVIATPRPRDPHRLRAQRAPPQRSPRGPWAPAPTRERARPGTRRPRTRRLAACVSTFNTRLKASLARSPWR